MSEKSENPLLQIGSRKIGPGQPVYIIAEMSGNHGHDFEKAKALVHAAKEAGADAIKLQTYTADTITLKCDNEHFRIKGTIFEGRTLHDLYTEACTPWEWQPELKKLAESLGLDCFSSPFDFTAVDFLETMDVPAYKIASFELVDIPLIEKAAATGKPMIFSTGMATLAEIEKAVFTARKAGAPQVALLKCTSAVPAPLEEMNLKTIPFLARTFGTVVGLSDHSPGIVAPVSAVALGVSIIEKHLKLDGDNSSPDCAFSLDASDFRTMVDSVRQTEKVLGNENWSLVRSDERSRQFRRSLFVVKGVEKGELFTPENVRSIRPGQGLEPIHLREILGKTAAVRIEAGTPFSLNMLASES